MDRKAVQYRYLKQGEVPPNFTYEWRLATDPAPTGTDVTIVDTVSEESVSIKQDQGTNAHYGAIQIAFDVPTSATRYKDWTAPDLTLGVDILQVNFSASELSTGDRIVAGKCMIGQIAQVAVAASTGATSITLAAPTGMLCPTALGGVIDEGFYFSFGTDNVTDETLNQGGSELAEYRIKRIGNETEIGGGVSTCEITLLTALLADVAQGAAANLVCRFIQEPIEVVAGNNYSFGEETEKGGNLPAGRRIRTGYENNSGSAVRVRGDLSYLY